LATGWLRYSQSFGGILKTLDTTSLEPPDLTSSADPMVRSSYLTHLGRSCAFAARHREALSSLALAAREIDKAKLIFAEHEIGLSKAVALIGLRRFTAAKSLLARTSIEGDHHATNYALQRSRLNMSMGRHQQALEALAIVGRPSNDVTFAESLSYRALAHALLGQRNDAVALAVEANEITTAVETRVIARFAQAIAADERVQGRLVSDAIEVTEETGFRDGALLVLRAWPQFSQFLAIEETQQALSLRAALNLAEQAARRGATLLSPREQEVLDLMKTGLTNREIASTLFISEMTVKVHIRHILDKLGVRTRVEAIVATADG
jgi:DNA-binding CsgD family transcriptional regulator